MPDELSEAPLDEPPDVSPGVEPGGMVDEGLSLPPVPLVPLVPDDVPLLLAPLESDGMPVEPPLVPASEPPPVMPAQAPSSTAQAMGNIHLVIEHSR